MIGGRANADEAVAAVIRASVPGRAVSAMSASVQRAWIHSHTRRMAAALAAQPVPVRIRLLAVTIATAGSVALVLTLFANPASHFTWIAPAAALVWSIVVLASQAASR